ncbi:unnamed protein product, partial [Vitis vinifera]|uniref:Uncharacterized protein n=1 Tax=Vitis vinifera TaxID=29760 RepID=D7T214_VITVI
MILCVMILVKPGLNLTKCKLNNQGMYLEKVMAMFEKAEDEYYELISKKSIICL